VLTVLLRYCAGCSTWLLRFWSMPNTLSRRMVTRLLRKESLAARTCWVVQPFHIKLVVRKAIADRTS